MTSKVCGFYGIVHDQIWLVFFVETLQKEMMKLCLVEDVFGCCPRLVGKVTRWDKRLLAARTGWAWIEREELVSFFFVVFD
ncbi:hypothetical protein HN51_063010 [Arachis hypogaea]